MSDEHTIELVAATAHDAELLGNLLELYIHDLSAAFPNIVLGANGRYGYPRLPLYWSEPDRRFAYLIRFDGQVAGFALVTRGSPVDPDPTVFDVAEFFVMRRFRRVGAGRRAAHVLWRTLRGAWTVRVSEGNPGALAFWSAVIAEFSRGAARESTRPGTPNAWRVFSFDSRE